ncbi:hypothetical protein J2755_000667 [Methanohalophilus levihalophilus]|uniref:hypothetical protein n=1 Tax=Methanohalophilus levihalophilus TaxID=1431282 RepID=UPI001AEA4EC3|nr:hypothetical protein [Methanohalophilus levihalophilus]MBP2029747.1 hypothetical protein [Methanohalophilus levihalophilus]
MKKEKVCLTETQMEHIIDAARNEPGACPKAKDFVESFRPTKESNIVLQAVDRHLEKKAKKLIRDFQRWF